MIHPFFDVGAFPFDNPLGSELHASLSQVIPNPEAIELRCQRCLSSIQLNKNAAPLIIWKEALEKLAAALKINKLCEELLADHSVASLHSIVQRVVDAAPNNVSRPTLQPKKGKMGTAPIASDCVVLVVTANPRETTELDLAKEADMIRRIISAGRPGHEVLVQPEHSISINQLRHYLHEYSPQIVHFAGHGDDAGNMLFEADDRTKQVVSPLALANLLREFHCVEAVVLNACYSVFAAEELSEFVECVVGMGNKIDNESALEFALAFYESLAFGRDYATAFRLGCNAIDLNHMPDSDQPIAFLPGMKTTDASIARQKSSISGRKQRSELPKSTSLESVRNEQVVSVKLWFGTNRKPNDTRRFDSGFSNDRDDKINFGTCEVAVPRRRAVGSLGSWAWYRWLTWNDDRVKLDWKSLVKYEPLPFWESLQESVAVLEDGKKHAVVFIHGFNVSFKDAALRTAQLAVDLPLPGPATFFSWPSRGYMLGYAADEATIRYTEKYLIEFLTHFVQQSGAERIHLIAHSMGNRGLLDAMDKVIVALNCEKPFDQVILAAPDVDLGEFGQKADIYSRAAKQTTLYASQRDWAVWASNWVHLEKRVGYYDRREDPRIFQAIDTVHIMSTFDLFELGHGYVASEDRVLSDIHQAINFGAPPKERRLTGKTFAGNSYWELAVD